MTLQPISGSGKTGETPKSPAPDDRGPITPVSRSGGERSGTRFSPAAPASDDVSVKLSGAVRKAHAGEPVDIAPRVTAADIHRGTKHVLGRTTSNDGAADHLVKGTHTGRRDERIQVVESRRAMLLRQQDHGEVAEMMLEKKLGRFATDSADLGMVGARAFALSAVDRKELADITARNEVRAERIEQREERLDTIRGFNFLADVAHVTNMPAPIADVLDGDAAVKVEVADEGVIDSDASYNASTKQIEVAPEVMDEVVDHMTSLQEKGIVDEDGRIIDAEAFDADVEDGDASISYPALIVAHEGEHAFQDSTGDLAEDTLHAQQVALTRGDAAGEAVRVDDVEYQAYVAQETVELQSGKEKQGFITIESDGSLLPRDEADANIVAFQQGETLPYGESAGEQFGRAITTPLVTGAVSAQIALSAAGVPGLRAPGDDTPGLRAPALGAPGLRAPGDGTPGLRAPGDDTPGLRAPALGAPGLRAPGDETPGLRAPGLRAPGDGTPGLRAPGEDTPGLRAPGLRAPGSGTPGLRAPGDETPGLRAPGLRAPGNLIDEADSPETNLLSMFGLF